MVARASGAFFKMSVTSGLMSTFYAEAQTEHPKRPTLRAFENPTPSYSVSPVVFMPNRCNWFHRSNRLDWLDRFDWLDGWYLRNLL